MSDSALLEQEPTSEPAQERKAFAPLPGVDWAEIEREFIRGASINDLTRKYQIREGTIAARCARGGWNTKRNLAQSLAQSLQARDCKPNKTPVYSEQSSMSEVASLAVDLTTEALRWKERTYKTALKLANGVDRLDTEGMGSDGQTKKLAEAASALASIDTTARRQLGLDVQDAEDFGLSHRATGRPGERHVMRRAQVIDVAPAEVATPEAFDPSI